MKTLLLPVILLCSVLCGSVETSYSQTKRGKVGTRHIWQKNSQQKQSFLCRDGAISHSKTRRGACSRHRGIAKRL